MHLLKDDGHGNLSLVEKHEKEIPPYAILSHTWGAEGEEVTFKDLTKGTGLDKAGYKKIEFCRTQAASDGLQFFWVDTCCINKSSSSELSEAINSMFHWYRNAVKCYVYLPDVSTAGEAIDAKSTSSAWKTLFRRSRWFTRGWTLQELIAPASVEFFSQEHDRLGSKQSLEETIHEITGIAIPALRGEPLLDFGVKERFSWAAHRETKRQEDEAYSLLGIFDVSMPLLYGEGREKAFFRLREAISKLSNSPIKQPESIPLPSSTVPFRPDVDFIDRRASYDGSTLLEQIEQRCGTPAARVALVGIGGAGKSQLAIEYCRRLRERSPDRWVFWVHASNVERIEQGYREIAEQVKIPGRNDPQQNVFELVARWLRDASKARWLLILDNADDDAVFSMPQAAMLKAQTMEGDGQLRRPLSAYLPQSENGAILVTTRTRSVATMLVEPRDVIAVNPMIDTDAIGLLRKKLGEPARDSDLKALVSMLENMPLAIVQAAAYIQQKGARYSVAQYIQAFQRNEKKKTSLLNYEAGNLRRDVEAKNSIIITWQISFDDIRAKWPFSANLLSLMSYFDRQGIPAEILKIRIQEEEIQDSAKQNNGNVLDDEEDEYLDIEEDGSSEANDDDMFEEAVERLQSYSFVSIGEDGRTFEMHALVQLAMRKWLEMHGEEEIWKAQFSQKLNTVFPNGEHKNWGLCRKLFPHAKSAETQRPAKHQPVQEWAQLLRKAGWYAWAKGDYIEGERMCKKSVGALRKTLGDRDVETSHSLAMLASIYAYQGRWTEAEKIQVQVMEARKRVLGEEHPSTLTSIHNLALTIHEQGRWIEAEKIQVQVMEARKRVLGEEHPDTLTSMDNLAVTIREQGRWMEAEKIQVQVVEARKRVLGEEHPSTLTSMNNLALTIREQGRWMEAEKIQVQVMEARKRVLGEEHPDTLTSINNLALTIQEQGRWTEAEKIQVQVVEARKRVLGEEHPSTLNSMNNLAVTIREQGRLIEAEKIQVQVMEARKRVQGEEHPDTLTSMDNLALTIREQGRWTEAEKIQVQVMEARKRVLGEEHPDTLTSIDNLALTIQEHGRWIEAEKIQVQVMEARKRVLGEEHPDTLTSMNNLALTIHEQGRWTEAEKIQVQVVEARKRVLGEEHPSTLTSMNNLALTIREHGRWMEAEKIQVQVMEARKRVLGEEHPDTLTSMNNLALAMREQGRKGESITLMAECVQLCNQVLGPEHPNTLSSTSALAEWQGIE